MAERQPRRTRWLAAATLILLLASLAQFSQLGRERRFLPDEAFFMTFARRAAVQGEWLLPGALDKPPLFIYLSALSMVFVGVTADAGGVLQLDPLVGEFAGKLPNVFLALLLAALLMWLARRLYGSDWAAAFAGLLALGSPYLLAYGASAFTDVSMLFWSTLALYAALRGRWAMAGAGLALALWSKQQAALLAPLIVAWLLARAASSADWRRFALALAGSLGALLLWDAARPETSLFLQAAANNKPAELLAPPSQWLPRLDEWLRLGAWLLGSPIATLPLSAGALVAGVFAWRVGRPTQLEAALLIAIIGYLCAHTILRFNHYDRYLLPILPLWILLVAGQLARGQRIRWLAIAVLAANAVWSMSAGGPIGGDARTSAGVDALAAHLNAKPVATVIYDPWLGWELGYYLGAWHDKRRVHHPTAESLAAGALALQEVGDRYFVAPLDAPYDDWLTALREAGFGIQLDYARDGFIVYRVAPPQELGVWRRLYALY